MTAALPPHDRDQLAALERERNPDPNVLASERHRPVPPAPGHPVPPRRRGQPLPAPTRGMPSYAAQHAALRAWIRSQSYGWLPDLFTLGEPIAHVIIQRNTSDYAVALCGADGYPELASDLAAPCSVCRSFKPSSR